MANGMTTYGLPCECGAEIPVTAGQAGGHVTCPRCARDVAVPKLRDLGQLGRRESFGVKPAGAWRPAHAATLLGSIIFITALAAATWLDRGPTSAIDEQALRAMILAADDLAVYRGWTGELSRASVYRPPADQELAVLRRARFAGALSRGLSVVAGAGLLAALAGVSMLLLAPRGAVASTAEAAGTSGKP